MAAKDSEAEGEKTEQQPQVIAPVLVQTEKPKNSQSTLTIAIISAVVLFFVGIGLGYVLGHTVALHDRDDVRGGSLRLPRDGGGRRFYPNSNTNTNGSSNNSNPSPQTQTN